MEKKKCYEATLCLGEGLDSRAVVGLDERNLFPGHIGLQGVRSDLVVPGDDSRRLSKNNSL